MLTTPLLSLPPSLPPSQAVTNFVTYKFGQLPQNEWQRMYDLAKMFLYCFNHWKLETPSVHARNSPTDDHKTYKENYTRYSTYCSTIITLSIYLYTLVWWEQGCFNPQFKVSWDSEVSPFKGCYKYTNVIFGMVHLCLDRWVSFCHVPVFCESLQKYDATLIFGRTFLSSVFLTMRRQLMDRFTAEQDKMLPEKRTLVITHFPKLVSTYTHTLTNSLSLSLSLSLTHTHIFSRFLSILENEIYNASSPIWREDFNQTPEALTVPSPASITPSHSPAGPSSVPTGPGSVPTRSSE